MPPFGALTSLAAALTSLEAPVFALSLHVFALTLTVVLPNARRMFGPRYARRHRAAGAAYLALLLVGALDLLSTVARDRAPPWLPHPAPLSLTIGRAGPDGHPAWRGPRAAGRIARPDPRSRPWA